jgi:hypothetical protein
VIVIAKKKPAKIRAKTILLIFPLLLNPPRKMHETAIIEKIIGKSG